MHDFVSLTQTDKTGTALTVGSLSGITVDVQGSANANLGGTVTLNSSNGVLVQGSLATDSGSSGTVNINALGTIGINAGTQNGSITIAGGSAGAVALNESSAPQLVSLTKSSHTIMVAAPYGRRRVHVFVWASMARPYEKSVPRLLGAGPCPVDRSARY